MKNYTYILYILIISFSCLAENNDYETWLDNYLNTFKNSSIRLKEQDKNELSTLLEIKPQIQSNGKYYIIWFNKAFSWYMDETNNLSRSYEQEKMKYIIDARPLVSGYGYFYDPYLKYVINKINNFLPVLNDSEKRCIKYFEMVKPESSVNDSSKWLSEYNRMQEDFGPVYSDNENIILQFMIMIRPTQQNNTTTIYKLSTEELLKIKNLILNNQPNTAVNEIDKILAGES